MKYLLLICTLLIVLSSCKKKTYCFTCSVVSNTTYTGPGAVPPPSNSMAQKDYCEKTDDDIINVQKEGTYTTTGTSGNITVTTKVTTTCNKK